MVSTDIADLEHDKLVVAGRLREDTRFLLRDRPCPMPKECRWVGRVCKTCGKKRSAHRETDALLSLMAQLDGGMPLDRSDLSAIQWELIGRMRQASRTLAAVGGFNA